MIAATSKILDVLIVDDHPLLISGCRSLFASDPHIRLSQASVERSGHEAYLEIRPDISIIDINLPGLSGFELLRRIRKEDPSAKIIMFSMNDEPAFIVRANPASQLSSRELEILRLLSRGKNIGEVAETLDISYKTVANSTSRLKQKLGAHSHSDLIRIAVELSLT